MRGDLDWIVMKALEKDRTRRYETASAFAADVAGIWPRSRSRPRPPSAAYRFGKFALCATGRCWWGRRRLWH